MGARCVMFRCRYDHEYMDVLNQYIDEDEPVDWMELDVPNQRKSHEEELRPKLEECGSPPSPGMT